MVHPDYHAINSGQTNSGLLHPLQEGLRVAWEEKARETAAAPNQLMVYISALKIADMISPRTDLLSIQRDDLDRIGAWKKLLHDRLIVFPTDNFVTKDKMDQELKRRNLTIDSDNATLVAFGEYEQWCVRGETDNTQYALGIPEERTFIDQRLSLSYVDYDPDNNEIYPVRRQRERV